MFVKYPKIYGLHNVVKNHTQRKRFNPDIEDKIVYRPKIKLHGTNAGIRVDLRSGEVVAQRRSSDATVEDDNFEFAAWVETIKHLLTDRTTFDSYADVVTVEGEWAGPGVQKGVAVSEISERTFFIFSVRHRYHADTEMERAIREVSPAGIEETLPDEFLSHSQVRVLPWYDDEIEANMNSRDDLNLLARVANEEIKKIDLLDPYIKEEYGIEGPGEGLVFYAVYDGSGHLMPNASEYLFKVKGEKHSTNKAGKSAKIDIVLPNEVFELVDQVVTEARLEQGLQETGATEKSDVGKLIGWVCKDTMEECRDEFEAFGVPIKKVQGPIAAKTREWFFEKIENDALDSLP